MDDGNQKNWTMNVSTENGKSQCGSAVSVKYKSGEILGKRKRKW